MFLLWYKQYNAIYVRHEICRTSVHVVTAVVQADMSTSVPLHAAINEDDMVSETDSVTTLLKRNK